MHLKKYMLIALGILFPEFKNKARFQPKLCHKHKSVIPSKYQHISDVL